jgi:hypothetical protein
MGWKRAQDLEGMRDLKKETGRDPAAPAIVGGRRKGEA